MFNQFVMVYSQGVYNLAYIFVTSYHALNKLNKFINPVENSVYIYKLDTIIIYIKAEQLNNKNIIEHKSYLRHYNSLREIGRYM